MEKILIVDDDEDLRFNLSTILAEEGYTAISAVDGREALRLLKEDSPNLVLLDIRLPKMRGMKILEKAKELDKNLPVIMLTGFGDVKDAVRAMRLGAFDYITKPFNNDELILNIKKALQTQHLTKEVESLRKRLGERIITKEVMGESPQIRQVLDQVKIVAPTNMTVILQGESGTGKELIANLIHQQSRRNENAFIAINSSAIPETLVESELFGYEKGAFTGAEERREGKFELANKGTLFLDEIANLSDSMQMKLLRVLEERKLQHLGSNKDIGIDVRIIAATNANLSELVRRGRFRDDLYHRLNEFFINLPLLKERKEDIPILTRCFLDEANRDLGRKIKGFSNEAMKFLLNYDWPGNVRELKNAIKKATLLADSDHIHIWHLSLTNVTPTKEAVTHTLFPQFQKELEEGSSLKTITKNALKEIEKEVIEQVLIKVGGNKTKAAKILKIDRVTLYSKMKEFQLEK